MANEIQELKFQVGEAWKGVYSSSTAYGLANVVQDPTGLSIYRSLKSGNVGHPLSNASWWFRIIDLSSIKSESDRIAALNQAIAQDEALRVAAEELRQQHEAERVAAETQRNEAEQQRISAEQARVNAESARATAEQQRITAEQGRVSAESARVQAEQARVLAETLRANAEDQRVANEQNRVAAEQQRIERAEQDHQRAESDHATYVDSLGAFDISSYHATDGVLAKYADLKAALGTGGANIPDNLRKGGMSVKFVQSSDNNYVQYFLTKNTWSTSESDWEKSNLAQDVENLEKLTFGADLDLTQGAVNTFDDSGTWYSGNPNYQGIFFPIPAGCEIEALVGNSATHISFLTAKGTTGSVQYANLGRQTLYNTDRTVKRFQTDENTHYIWVQTNSGGSNDTPSYVKILSALPDYSQYFISVPKSQLFDRTQVETGYCDLDGYVHPTSTNYVYTKKIDVHNYIGRTIYFSANGSALTSSSFRFITVYNAQGNAVSALGVSSGAQNISTFIVPEGANSIVITYTAPNGSNNMDKFQAEFDHITEFSSYEVVIELLYSLIERNVQYHIDNSPNTDKANVLNGKKWVACGDSFTHGDFTNAPEDNYHIEDGLYQGQLKVYPYLIGNRNNMVIINEAINGSAMTYLNEDWAAFSKPSGRYTQIPLDADYITLKFGINDDSYHQDAPIGTIDDNTNETFYGAWNIVLDYIIQSHPQAKIGIIVTNGATLDIVNATIAIAKKWGLPYLNEATDEQCSFMFRSNRTDVVSSVRTLRNNHWYVSTQTGLENSHPNALAHEFESTVVEAWLRTL